ncbi:SIDL trafficking protein particle complex subunit 10 [Dermatophagoides pteronyssinus]|uniref:SIDL trafficking protein particle complex subunit 10 n=1 Tax=Dermatophagoides pteronyssinus TaxID=6956 RepID=UPI003F6760E2
MATCSHNDDIIMTNLNDKQDIHYHLCHQAPLITVFGELSDFLLQGHLATQINSDLARESIDWQNFYDVSPIPVYVEAYFVRLNDRQHLLWDPPPTPKSPIIDSPSQSTPTTAKLSATISNNDSTIGSNRIRQLNASTLKRHHSFQNMITSASNINGQNVRSILGSHTNSNSAIADSQQQQQQQQQQSLLSIDYHHLFNLLSRRYLVNNGARVLLNSYWLDSNHDLESYNSQIRDSLLDWFQKILQIATNQHQLGLNQDFSLDFFVVIVIRNCINSSNTCNNRMTTTKHSQEQLLNLNNLVNETNSSSRSSSSTVNLTTAKAPKNSDKSPNIGKKQMSRIQTQPPHPLSSSMSSLNTTGHGSAGSLSQSPTYLTHQQLADQIRNDLLVCFQLFRQNQSTNCSNMAQSGIPSNNSRIAHQLLERIIIFDSTSNSSSNAQNMSNMNQSNISTGSNTGGSVTNNMATSTNPILSSTARTFSALSNFSTSSIKIAPTSMILMSPTKSGSRLSKTSALLTGTSSTSSSSSSSVAGSMSSTVSYNYSQFIIKIRQFLLEFYSKQFHCFEKLIRHIRELRTDPDWDFFGFFLLQEELAFAHESLGLYNKALVQYDELDALFSQLILNASHHGGFGAPRWLRYRLMQSIDDSLIMENETNSNYKNTKSEAWTGLCLCNQESIMKLRMSIVESVLADISTTVSDFSLSSSPLLGGDPLGVQIKPNSHQISLLDFRNYLYARQCHLLCLLNKPWELASRALPFLQTAVAELNMLEISMTPGGIACWVFLSVLEILHKCERYSDSSQLESYSYHTVGLWSYARDNLIELGKICNLMPYGDSTIYGDIKSTNTRSSYSSEHLHRMVELVAGMGADPHIRPSSSSQSDDDWMSPQERLKDALSSPELFLRHYLEITELTMGTYKHIGHIRCARLIGKQLAELNLKLNKPQQALPFLLDLYHMFQMEHWSMLKQEACRLLAQCLEQLYFNISNTLIQPVTDHQSSSCNNFNLEPIIRSAFRTYLILFLKPEGLLTIQSQKLFDSGSHLVDMCQNKNLSQYYCHNYLESMFRLIRHYEMRAFKLKDMLFKQSNEKLPENLANFEWLNQKLLAIHNSHSDLFNEGSSNSSIGGRSSSRSSPNDPIGCNSNSSSSSNINNNFGDSTESTIKKQRNNHQESNFNKANSNELLASQQQQQCGRSFNDPGLGRSYSHHSSSSLSSSSNYNEPNFFQIESIEIDCDSSLNDTNSLRLNGSSSNVTTSRKNNQSFIAGSVLTLRLKLFSHLGLPLKLDRMLVTVQCHRNDPWLSTLPNSVNNRNEKSSQETNAQVQKCSCMIGTDSQQLQRDSSESIDCINGYNRLSSCCQIPSAQVERYYCQTLRLTGVKCLNGDRLLRRTDFLGYRNGSFDGYHKFMSQSLPISLLNQRLSYDDYSKYFRFLSSQFQFSVLNSDEILMLETGSNEYELRFYSPENLHTIAQQLDLFDQSESAPTNHHINHLWFNLDQLILFCHFDNQLQNSSAMEQKNQTMNFALIEDFSTAIRSINFNRSISGGNAHGISSFRLVECPPSIELVPLFEPEESYFQTMSNMCFIGIEQSVCLRLNSGTSKLPKGLKCFIKINQISSMPSSTAIISSNHMEPFEYNSRLINVTLYQPNDNEELFYFFLDHQLEPFETYQLNLRLRSSYHRSKLIQIHGTNNWNQISSIDSKPKHGGSASQVDQYEFQLSLTWKNLDNVQTFDLPFNQSSLDTQMACCQFTLSDPFDVFPRVYTPSPQRKLLKIQVRGSQRLPSYIELYFQHPTLIVPFLDSNEINILKPIGMENDINDHEFQQKLMASSEINFVWVLETNHNHLLNLNKMNLELQFKPKFITNESILLSNDNQQFGSIVKISYIISIQYSCRTRYTIRQWIEPLIKNQTGTKNSTSEIIRIGHSCLLRIKIERLDSSDEDEFIMYELICDPQLWQFVSISSSQQLEDSNNNIDDSISELNGGPVSISSHQSLQSTTTLSSMAINDGSRVIKFIGQSSSNMVNNEESQSQRRSFETSFEVIPLIDGYIPLPLVRLSQYKIISNESNNVQDSGRITPNTNNRIGQSSNNTLQKTTSNAIESISAMLSENLSLSGKNWSKYLTSSNSSQQEQRINVDNNNDAQQQSSLNSITSLRNARLEPFEPGQVYNYNRSSQVYVLPSNVGGSQNIEN